MSKSFSKKEIDILKIISGNNEHTFELLSNRPIEQVHRLIDKYYQRLPVIEDLNKHEIDIDDIQELLSSKYNDKDFEKALPVLVNWLKKDSLEDDAKASIVQVMLDRHISKQYAFDTILAIYSSLNANLKDKWGYKSDLPMMLGNALMRWIDDSHVEIVLKLFNQRSKDSFLIASFANFKDYNNKKHAAKSLSKLLGESRLEKDILLSSISTLRKLNVVDSIETINKYLDYPDSEVKSEAKKAQSKLMNIKRN